MTSQQLRDEVFELLSNAAENGHTFENYDAEGIIGDMLAYDAFVDWAVEPTEEELLPHVLAWMECRHQEDQEAGSKDGSYIRCWSCNGNGLDPAEYFRWSE